jgi:hypothetical protein
MFTGCQKNHTTLNFSLVKTETQQKIDDICQHCRNSRLRFLILLPETDYRKIFYSYKDIIWYRRGNFPGILSIEHFEESDQLPYQIEEPVMPRQLYIMLPKERIYVPSDQFTSRYIKSKMRELVQIFIALRAKSIKYIRYDSLSEHQNTNVNIDVDVPQITLSEGVQYENAETKRRGIQYEIRLNPSNEPIDVDVFSQPSFYYLKREPLWKDIILRRIDGGAIYDKYTYWNKEMKLLKSKFIQQLKCFNLSVEYDWTKFSDFMVDYEVVYEDEKEKEKEKEK